MSHAAPPRSARRVPPPLPLPAAGPEGLEILDELPGAAGFLLMASLRSVTLWARVEPAERPGLYLEGAREKRLREMRGAALPAEIRGPLAALASVLDAPEDAEARGVAVACRALSEWAEGTGHPATSYLFLHAAALADPGSPALALQVGRAARAHGDPATAESWLQHAVVLARGGEDWDSYALACLALGDLHLLRGERAAAHRAAHKALRVARRHRLRETRGIVHHGLAGLPFEDARGAAAATQHGRAALHAFGAGHPRLPLLAHDLAYLWTTVGHHRAALRVFEAMRPLLLRRSLDWLYLIANTARAAAGCGRPDAFAAARAECLEMSRLLGEPPGAAAAILEVALGAASLGDAAGARSLAAQVTTLAARHREEDVRARAAALLSGPPRVAGDAPRVEGCATEVEALSRELSLALERCTPLSRC